MPPLPQFDTLRWGQKTSHMVPGLVLGQLPLDGFSVQDAVLEEQWNLSWAVEGTGKTWRDPCSLELARGTAVDGGW